MTVDLDKLTEPFPKSAIKQREGGRGKALSYVEGHSVIHRLNDATNNCWSLEVKDISSKDITGTDNRGQQVTNTLMIARVALTIPDLGTREGLGVQMVHERGGEDLVKGCITDALKKAATLFGVGLELYGPDYEAGEVGTVQKSSRTQPPDTTPAPTRGPVTQPQGQAGDITGPQQGLIRNLMRDHGVSDESMHTMILVDYSVDHLRELTKAQASAFIQLLQGLPLAEAQGIKQEPQKGFEFNQNAVPDEPDWVRSAAGDDRFTA